MTITNNIIIIELYKDKGVKYAYFLINTGGEDVEISIDLTNLKCLCKIKAHNFSIEINGNEDDDVYVFAANPAGLTLKSELASPLTNNFKQFIIVEESTGDLITDNLNVVVKHIFNEYDKEYDNKYVLKTESLINCIFNEFIKNDQSKVNYENEATRLISNFHISKFQCEIEFKRIPPTMKYLVVYFNLPYDGFYYDQSFVMIYDNEQQSGSFILFSPDNRYPCVTSSVKKNTDQTTIQLSAEYVLDSISIEHFGTHDDTIEDTGYAKYFKYIKIIESDDALGELIGSVTYLLFNYKLSGYVKSNNIYTKAESDNKYVKTNGDVTINGKLTVNSTSAMSLSITCSNTGGWMNGYKAVAKDMKDNEYIANFIGDSAKQAYYGYRKPGTGSMGVSASPDCITFTSGSVSLNRSTTVNASLKVTGDSTIEGNLVVNGKVTSNGSNTITHYAPIEGGEEISYYKIGRPVFMSGHVYKRVDARSHSVSSSSARWLSSTANDSTDCICSVNIDGSYKEFVGIITAVDAENGCITFATHSDYLFYVDDANLYQIGDVLLYDGRILDEDYAMTLKIQQSIIGKVSSKINEHYIALFKA